MIASIILARIKRDLVLSIKPTIIPIMAVPPSHIAIELNQQQLVPTTNATILPIIVFL